MTTQQEQEQERKKKRNKVDARHCGNGCTHSLSPLERGEHGSFARKRAKQARVVAVVAVCLRQRRRLRRRSCFRTSGPVRLFVFLGGVWWGCVFVSDSRSVGRSVIRSVTRSVGRSVRSDGGGGGGATYSPPRLNEEVAVPRLISEMNRTPRSHYPPPHSFTARGGTSLSCLRG
jgi:hypothetical protein